jgi:F0F1-type ATP synthase assembly protein I
MPPDSPGNQPETPKRSALTQGVAGAERILEIAFIMPAALVIGWLIGAGLDKWLHQHWIYLVGIVFGCIAGFIQIFRLVQNNEKQMEKEDQ